MNRRTRSRIATTSGGSVKSIDMADLLEFDAQSYRLDAMPRKTDRALTGSWPLC